MDEIKDESKDEITVDLNTLIEDTKSRQLHIPGHHYTGSGTHLKHNLQHGIRPINAVDSISMTHDIAYSQVMQGLIMNQMTLEEAREAIHKADIEMVKALHQLEGYTYGKVTACCGMSSKVILDKFRRLIGCKNPIYPNLVKLLKQAENKRKQVSAEQDAYRYPSGQPKRPIQIIKVEKPYARVKKRKRRCDGWHPDGFLGWLRCCCCGLI